MVPGRRNILRKALENGIAVVDGDGALFSVHQPCRVNDFGTEYLTDTLMSEAHAEDRDLALHLADHILTNTGVFRISGSGREDDVVRMKVPDFFWGHRIVPDHPDIRFCSGYFRFGGFRSSRYRSGTFPRMMGSERFLVLQTERAEKLDQIVRKAVVVIDQ